MQKNAWSHSQKSPSYSGSDHMFLLGGVVVGGGVVGCKNLGNAPQGPGDFWGGNFPEGPENGKGPAGPGNLGLQRTRFATTAYQIYIPDLGDYSVPDLVTTPYQIWGLLFQQGGNEIQNSHFALTRVKLKNASTFSRWPAANTLTKWFY